MCYKITPISTTPLPPSKQISELGFYSVLLEYSIALHFLLTTIEVYLDEGDGLC